MTMIDEQKAPHRVLISKEMWELQYEDVDLFKEKVREYLEKGYPGYKPIKASDGFIICTTED